MAREYIPKAWVYGKPAWNRTKWLLSAYDSLVRERQDILYGSHKPPDGMPKGSGVSNPTEAKAMRLVRINEELDAIEQSAMQMRGWLSKEVQPEFDPVRAFWSYDYYNYMFVRKKDDNEGPCIRTWRTYRVMLMTLIAQRAKII